MKQRTLCSSLALLALLALAGDGQAQGSRNTCDPQDPPWGKELQDPAPIVPENGVLDTTFVVRKRDLCVPVWTTGLCRDTYISCNPSGAEPGKDPVCGDAACDNIQVCVGSGKTCTGNSDCGTNGKCVGTWGWETQHLRSYGYPKKQGEKIDPANPDDSNIQWGYPGPTLTARTEILKDPSEPKSAANPASEKGTRIKIGLYNYLDPQDYKETGEACDDAGPDYKPTYPECFHGPEVTNLHYHGTHVSPQPHQDYVLLSLWPFGSKNVPVSEDTQVGMYQTDINLLPWNQAPGTHWYHPHKHGSTALQVLNGMAGSLLISGPFDDWLNDLYGGELVDRVLVVQQVAPEVRYFKKKNVLNYPPQALINGLATPKIKMRPGEIQRWRFIGATMQASASLEIGFDPRIKEVRQIAQDGVQFQWENYYRQPYRDAAGTYSDFKLSPGNRADFLIQAPKVPGTYVVEHNVFVRNLNADVVALHRVQDTETAEDRIPRMAVVREGKPPIDPTAGTPLLFTIEVAGEPQNMEFPVTQKTDPACATEPAPKHCWPETPAFLRDLPRPGSQTREIDFSMTGTVGSPPRFFINDTQYQHGCAGAAMSRGAIEDWLVSNNPPTSANSSLPHPFHIHINPFQVVRNADRAFESPFVWQDTIALPVTGTSDRKAGPIWNQADAEVKCPRACDADNATWNGQWTTTRPGEMSVCGCELKTPNVLIRHRFEDYTGAYVIHCHFLGHEDRGMMWNVETVCDPNEPWKLGAPQTDGGPDKCPSATKALACCDANPTDCGPMKSLF